MGRSRKRNSEDGSIWDPLIHLALDEPGTGTIMVILLGLIGFIFRYVPLHVGSINTDVGPLLSLMLLLIAVLLGMVTLIGWLRLLLGINRPPPPLDIEAGNLPYCRAKLLSDGEKAFYDVLIDLVPPEQVAVLLKVRLLDLADLPKGLPRREGWKAKVERKHVDFVLCDRKTAEPFMAIELDDKSHERPDRADSDRLKDLVLPLVGIPLERVRCQRAYDVSDLKQRIARHLPTQKNRRDAMSMR